MIVILFISTCIFTILILKLISYMLFEICDKHPRDLVHKGWLTWNENFNIVFYKRKRYHLIGFYRYLINKPFTQDWQKLDDYIRDFSQHNVDNYTKGRKKGNSFYMSKQFNI